MPRKKMRNLGEVVDLLKQLPEDVFEDIRDTRPPQERKGLVEMLDANNKQFDELLSKLAHRAAKKKPRKRS